MNKMHSYIRDQRLFLAAPGCASTAYLKSNELNRLSMNKLIY